MEPRAAPAFAAHWFEMATRCMQCGGGGVGAAVQPHVGHVMLVCLSRGQVLNVCWFRMLARLDV